MHCQQASVGCDPNKSSNVDRDFVNFCVPFRHSTLVSLVYINGNIGDRRVFEQETLCALWCSTESFIMAKLEWSCRLRLAVHSAEVNSSSMCENLSC